MIIKTLHQAYADKRGLTPQELKRVYNNITSMIRKIKKVEDSLPELYKLWRYHHHYQRLRYRLKAKTVRRTMPLKLQRNRLREALPRFMTHTAPDVKQVAMAIRILLSLRARLTWLRAKRNKHLELIKDMKTRYGPKYRYRGVKETL